MPLQLQVFHDVAPAIFIVVALAGQGATFHANVQVEGGKIEDVKAVRQLSWASSLE